jgi:hypothetical protein
MQRTEETVVFINTNSLLCGTHICKIDQKRRAYNSGSKPVGGSPSPLKCLRVTQRAPIISFNSQQVSILQPAFFLAVTVFVVI